MRRSFPLVVAALAIALVAPVAPAGAGGRGSVTVDSWIVSADGVKVGQGVTSPTAVGETLETSAPAPSRLVFEVVATPVGGRSTVTFLGGAGSPDFAVQYLSADGTDVTLKVTGRGYRIRGVTDGQRVRLTLIVRLNASARGRSANLAVLAKTSDGRDMVAAFVTGV